MGGDSFGILALVFSGKGGHWMPKKWKYLKLIANVLGVGGPGDQFTIGEESDAKMAADWYERGLAVYTDEPAASVECGVGSAESGVHESPVLPLLQDASIEDLLAKASTDLELAGKPQLAEAIELIRADLSTEYIPMAAFARRVGVEAEEIEKAVKAGQLTRYEVDGKKLMLKADEALAAWEAASAAAPGSATEASDETPADPDGSLGLEGIDPNLQP